MDGLIVESKPRRSVELEASGASLQVGVTQDGCALLAGDAAPAVRIPGENDVLSNTALFHPRTDGCDGASGLVPGHDRDGRSELPRDELEVRVAKTRGADTHQDLPRRQRARLHGFHTEGAARTSKDGGTETHLEETS
jgi:hypothetical protein